MTRATLSAIVLLAVLALSGGFATAQGPAAPAPQPSPDLLKPGDVVPAFDAPAAAGGTTRIDFPKGRSTVLLFFLSSCPTCHKMIPEWNRMMERKPKALPVYGIVMDQEPPGFFESMKIAFPVLRAPSREFSQSYKIKHVPVTLRVGPGGKVEDIAVGIVDPIKLGEIFRQ